MEQRESLGSRLGFILLSAGCAIGIGNVWKFPYITGQYGGGAFVVIYLIFLILMGAPIMTMEFAIGRASRKTATGRGQARGSRRRATGRLLCAKRQSRDR